MGVNSVHSLPSQQRTTTSTHHLTFFRSLGRSLYLTEAMDACASARDGALSPMRAYSSREMPSGFRTRWAAALRDDEPLDDPACGKLRIDLTSWPDMVVREVYEDGNSYPMLKSSMQAHIEWLTTEANRSFQKLVKVVHP